MASKSDATEEPSAQDTASPRLNSNRVVSIAEPESISPLMRGKHKDLDYNDSFELDKPARRFRANVSGKRLSGRPSLERLGSSKTQSLEGNPSLSSLISEGSDPNVSPQARHTHEGLLKQVATWLKHEKSRRAERKTKRKSALKDAFHRIDPQHSGNHSTEKSAGRERKGSDSSEGSAALEQLQSILERTWSLKSNEGSPRKQRSSHGRQLSAIMKRHSTVSSDTDYFDSVDLAVPSCDAVLDNSKTMAYGAGGAEHKDADTSKTTLTRQPTKEKEAWSVFKYEIVRLAHTLKLKGWRRVPLEQSNEIDVERLSGALTNAVYVVSPPKELRSQEMGTTLRTPKSLPPKLLLRIYGPQVEHLIDRDSELHILRRLAKKRIGPRLLGTFNNGRFEEYFNAKPLTPQELRSPDTSKQIAKRMRELHEGIELLKEEREAGPFIWRNWDKWVNRCEHIVTWLDQQILEGKQGPVLSPSDKWKKRGLVCGVEWPVFRQVIEKYRVWLEEQYGGIQKVNERLVFAHNDTQYGNILRMMPAGESPLLLPANEHKRLIVIDFEYANANLPGLEFANHFTEWCYNYHDPEYPYLVNTAYYPTPEEQYRFVRSYLTHNPAFKAASGSASNPPTPHFDPLPSSGNTTALAATAVPTHISAFMLDSRAPPTERYSYQEQEAQAEKQIEDEALRLLAETRLWRLANSVQWVAWGIVQAHVPGLPDFDSVKNAEQDSEQCEEVKPSNKANKPNDVSENGEKDDQNGNGNYHGVDPDANELYQQGEDEEFDYLGYAQSRAMFVWGDAIRLGIVNAEDLPEEVRKSAKIVDY